MDHETTAALEAISNSLQVNAGNAIAQQAIMDAVIATILRALPPLAVELHASLALTAQEYQPRWKTTITLCAQRSTVALRRPKHWWKRFQLPDVLRQSV